MGFEVVETSDLPTPGQFSHVVKKGNIVLSDPVTSVPLAIVDEHWSFSLRSTAATVVACRWMGPLDRATPLVLGLVGVGSMDFDTYDASDSASRIRPPSFCGGLDRPSLRYSTAVVEDEASSSATTSSVVKTSANRLNRAFRDALWASSELVALASDTMRVR